MNKRRHKAKISRSQLEGGSKGDRHDSFLMIGNDYDVDLVTYIESLSYEVMCIYSRNQKWLCDKTG